MTCASLSGSTLPNNLHTFSFLPLVTFFFPSFPLRTSRRPSFRDTRLSLLFSTKYTTFASPPPLRLFLYSHDTPSFSRWASFLIRHLFPLLFVRFDHYSPVSACRKPPSLFPAFTTQPHAPLRTDGFEQGRVGRLLGTSHSSGKRIGTIVRICLGKALLGGHGIKRPSDIQPSLAANLLSPRTSPRKGIHLVCLPGLDSSSLNFSSLRLLRLPTGT